MFTPKCPGQDTRYWKPEDIYEDKCPNCGNVLEFWKTDIRVRCEKCRRIVTNPRFNLGCAQWCSYAEQCLGAVAKGLGKTDTFLEKIKTQMESMLEKAAFQEVEETLDIAEEVCSKRKGELLVIAAAACLKILRDTFKENSTEAEHKFLRQTELPRLVFEEAQQVLAEYESNAAKSLNARMLDKVFRLKKVKTKG